MCFRAGAYVLTSILAFIIYMVVVAGPIAIAVGAIIGGSVLFENQPGVVAVVLFLVVGSIAAVVFIIVSTRLSMFFYIIIDQNAGVIESLTRSWRLTSGQIGTIIFIYCVQLVIGLAGLLALCVGLIFAAPLANMLLPATYLALTGTLHRPREKPEFVWEDDV